MLLLVKIINSSVLGNLDIALLGFVKLCLLQLLAAVVFIGLSFEICRIVALSLVGIAPVESKSTHAAHGKEEPVSGTRVIVGARDDGRGYKRTDKSRCLANHVEERKEHVRLRSGHDFGNHGHLVRAPSSSLEVPALGKPKLPLVMEANGVCKVANGAPETRNKRHASAVEDAGFDGEAELFLQEEHEDGA